MPFRVPAELISFATPRKTNDCVWRHHGAIARVPRVGMLGGKLSDHKAARKIALIRWQMRPLVTPLLESNRMYWWY